MTAVTASVSVAVAGQSVSADLVGEVTSGAALWVWSGVDPGSTAGYPTITIDDTIYPDSLGVQFWLNGVIDERHSARPNGYDATGPQEGSTYHMYPDLGLQVGDQLEAKWTDRSGVDHSAPHTVTDTGGGSGGGGSPPPPTGDDVVLPGLDPLTGWPTPTTVGASGTLTTVGNVVANTAGQVLSDLYVTGSITVEADNVTIRNCKIVGGTYPIRVKGTADGTIIEDVTIDGGPIPGRTIGKRAIYLDGYPTNVTVRRTYIHRVGSGIFGYVNGLTVSQIHIGDNYYQDGSHTTGTSTDGGSNISFTNCSIHMPNPGASSCTALYGRSPISNVSYTNCLIDDGGYGMNLGYGSAKEFDPSGVSVVGCRFVRDSFSWGPVRGVGPAYTLTDNQYVVAGAGGWVDDGPI